MEQPFTIWAAHKNLTHLRIPKRLKAHQAHFFPFLSAQVIVMTNRTHFLTSSSPNWSFVSPNHPPLYMQDWVHSRTLLETETDLGTGPVNQRFVPAASRPGLVHTGQILAIQGTVRPFLYSWGISGGILWIKMSGSMWGPALPAPGTIPTPNVPWVCYSL